MANHSVIDAFWTGGANSALEPSYLKETEYQWGVNVDNTGGIIQTRQGFSKVTGTEPFQVAPPKLPRGLTFFKKNPEDTIMVAALGDGLYYSRFPFTDPFQLLPGIAFRDGLGPVTFVSTYKSVERATDGSLAVIEPKPILIIQDGQGRALIWDGESLIDSDPAQRDDANGIPIGLWGQWSGNRYWVACGNKLRASNLGDPTTFTEEDDIAGGGAFVLPDIITGMGQTPDFRSLLVFTDQTTTSFQSNVYTRTDWITTPEFQKLILPSIGCAAGKSICNQYGITWFYSHQGLMGLDQALQTYRTSKVSVRDEKMARSKGNLSPDISGICVGYFGNSLMVSVPSGDGDNAHTWVLNGAITPTDTPAYSQSSSQWMGPWTGVRPVEWANVVIGGENRCYFLSKDYGSADTTAIPYGTVSHPYHSNVWEAFTGDRADINVLHSVPIISSFETRGLGVSPDLKRFEWAEVDLSELSGVLHLQIYRAGIRGGYKKILDKTIVASQGSVNGPEDITASTVLTSDLELFDPFIGPSPGDVESIFVTSTAGFAASGHVYIGGRMIHYTSKETTRFVADRFISPAETILAGAQVLQLQETYDPIGEGSTINTSYRPQRRTVRTVTETQEDGECSACSVESNRTDNVDRGFSLLIKWTGKVAINAIRMVYSDEKDSQLGACEPDETNARYVTELGCGKLDDNVLQQDTFSFGTHRSRYMRIFTPRHTEDPYRSFYPS
jgi:hypothetical protein